MEEENKKNQLKKILASLSLGKEEDLQASKAELFHIFYEEHFGPLKGSDIQDIISRDIGLGSDTLVKNIGENKWSPLFEHPFFQRRSGKGQETLLKKSKNDEFYLLKHGRKMGPLQMDDIKTKIDRGEITLMDMISVDTGQTWQKVFELKSFDRRKFNVSQELPLAPELSIFEDVEDEVAKDLKMARRNRMKDTIASLANFSNLDEKKQRASVLKKTSKNFMMLKNKTVLLASGIVFSSIVLITIMMNLNSTPQISPPSEEIMRSSLKVEQSDKKNDRKKSLRNSTRKSVNRRLQPSSRTSLNPPSKSVTKRRQRPKSRPRPRTRPSRRSYETRPRDREEDNNPPPSLSRSRRRRGDLDRRDRRPRDREFEADLRRNLRDAYDELVLENPALLNNRRRSEMPDIELGEFPEDLDYNSNTLLREDRRRREIEDEYYEKEEFR